MASARPRDRVFTLLEPVSELHFALLGTIRAGGVAGPLFSGFGAEAVAERLRDSGARVLVTNARHLHKARQARPARRTWSSSSSWAKPT